MSCAFFSPLPRFLGSLPCPAFPPQIYFFSLSPPQYTHVFVSGLHLLRCRFGRFPPSFPTTHITRSPRPPENHLLRSKNGDMATRLNEQRVCPQPPSTPPGPKPSSPSLDGPSPRNNYSVHSLGRGAYPPLGGCPPWVAHFFLTSGGGLLLGHWSTIFCHFPFKFP